MSYSGILPFTGAENKVNHLMLRDKKPHASYTTLIPSSRTSVSPKNGDATDPNTHPLASTRHVPTSYVVSHAMTSLVPPT